MDGAVITDYPTSLFCDVAQLAVRVDGHGGSYHGEHGDIVCRIRVGGAPVQIEALNSGEGRHGVFFTRAVKDIAHQAAGECAVFYLRDGA